MIIRIAVATDLPQIVEIYNQAITMSGCTADLESISVESRHSWFNEHSPENYPIWVAENEGYMLGWCSLSPYRCGRMALKHIAEISYYIDKDHRGSGVGSSLLQHAIGQCPGLQIKNLLALILGINIASIGIMDKFKFEIWGTLPDVAEVDGQKCDHLIFGRNVE
ncbi:MAG: N-acetyltransferase [bacterium]|nr:N-acetyltransferase [bacterium]